MLTNIIRSASIAGLRILGKSSNHVKPRVAIGLSNNRGIASREPRDFDDGLMPKDNNQDEDEGKIFDREFVDMKLEDYKSLYESDPSGELEKTIETVLSEYEYLKYNSMGRVPSRIDLIDMKRILDEGPTPSARDRLFNFLYKREMAKRAARNRRAREKESILMLKMQRQALFDQVNGNKRTGLLTPDGKLMYGLWHNTLFCRIPDNKLKTGRSTSRLIDAALYGRKVIFDFDFEDQMVPWISRNTMEQIQEAYGLNRFSYKDPFDIWFCNFDPNSNGGQFLANNSMRNLHTGSLITIKNDCFTKHFDKSRLVYLSPNARERLGDISKTDDVYIIGAYNDKGSAKPLTYRKAEALGIRSRSLPIDTYVSLASGTKSLCVNHVMGILLEVIANGGDWREALIKHIPQRKIKPLEVLMEEEARRNLRLRKKSMVKFSIRDDLDLS